MLSQVPVTSSRIWLVQILSRYTVQRALPLVAHWRVTFICSKTRMNSDGTCVTNESDIG